MTFPNNFSYSNHMDNRENEYRETENQANENNQTPRSPIRTSIMTLAGLYLIFLAYRMFRDAKAPDNTIPFAVSCLIGAVFAAVGAFVLIRGMIELHNQNKAKHAAWEEAEQAKKRADRAKMEMLKRNLAEYEPETGFQDEAAAEGEAEWSSVPEDAAAEVFEEIPDAADAADAADETNM